MRVPLVIALSVAGLVVGLGFARAADLSPRVSERLRSYEVVPGRPAGQILIYDYEPGVVVRAWWLPPWRDRHYFPFGVARPAAIHRERYTPPQRAKRFERFWSTCSLCGSESPEGPGRPPPLLPRPDLRKR